MADDFAERPVVVAHLSDCHLDARPEPLARLREVLTAVRAMQQLDVLLVSGDIANNGLAVEYEAFRAELPVGMPTVVIPGNHDSRELFEAHIGPRNNFVDARGARVVGLDATISGRDEGRLDEETLAFALGAIASAPDKVLLAVHQPPVEIGHPLIDETNLRDAEALAELIAASPKVIGLLTGHVHTAHTAMFAGVPLIGAPGIVSTLRYDVQDRISADSAAPPGFAVHRVAGDRLVTRFVSLAP
jgi:3',5'-cyclic AMP phosphodiesterase CpdA